MAGRDNAIFHATIASGTTTGTVVPLSILYGSENVRQGYGTPVLKNIRAVYSGGYSGDTIGIPIEVKNSNWIDAAGLSACKISAAVSLSRDSVAFMRGRDKVLQPNTAFTISATIPSNTTAAMELYVITEIEYSDVGAKNAESLAGSPVMKKASGAVTVAANSYANLGSFDNLLQGVEYVLSEVSAIGVNETYCYFLIVEGFSNQRGLTRIFPIRSYGISEQIAGSVILTKQSYSLGLISDHALSNVPFVVSMEMVASKN